LKSAIHNPQSAIENALSCDLEDYFQVQDCEGVVAREAWEAMPSRLEASTDKVLALLDEAGVTATFFVLGWNAERRPALVRRIAEAGHEVASHGYAHHMVFEQSPEEFRADICRAKALLEDLAGCPVLGYRAPTFSITARSLWAVPILAEAGYRYDSSIFPIRHDRYGIPSAPRFLHELNGTQGKKIEDEDDGRAREGTNGLAPGTRNPKPETRNACLVEFPPTTLRVLGCNVPVAGGGYLRLFPARVIRAALRRVNRLGHPAIVYFHPWELDPGQPRLPLRGLSRFRHYVSLARAADKLRLLLRSLSFTTAAAVVARWAAGQHGGQVDG
jgi:polysaccharide deacetylase family protein (PEP-CTERM system associated)